MKTKGGFTLVEIMIVGAIIGLLAALGMPSFSKARRVSQQKACLHNLRTIEAGIIQYMMFHHTKSATIDEAVEYLKNNTLPKCPQTGTSSEYSVSDNEVRCIVHGTNEQPSGQ